MEVREVSSFTFFDILNISAGDVKNNQVLNSAFLFMPIIQDLFPIHHGTFPTSCLNLSTG
jgi:hypothetical protein